MKVLQRYIAGEVARSILFVLAAFLALQEFFDMAGEIKSIGQGNYQLPHAFLYVLLGMPGNIYEMMPIAALIGTIWALAQFASRSEFTIMRVSGMSTLLAARMLATVGLVFVVATYLVGEVVAPWASETAEHLKLRAQGTSISQEFRSGLWAKDVIRKDGLSGPQIGSRFLNVAEVRPDGELRGVKSYDFDNDFRLTALVTAARAHYIGAHEWQLNDVSITDFSSQATSIDPAAPDLNAAISTVTVPQKTVVSEITPNILGVLATDPDRMSAANLRAFTAHLAENKQHTERYEIAFWKKIVYPFAILVMMALALPFGYLHVRAGGVSLKIFIGIMIGVSFYLLNSLFSHVGLLNTWPPLLTAVLPSLCFLLLAISSLWWVERH